jgi:tetratricopeptide (TPR) repeat protein
VSEIVSRFVGVGIDQYDDKTLDKLTYAVAEVEAVADLLKRDFVGEPVSADDVTADGIRSELMALADEGAGVLVLVWAGHAEVEGKQLLLKTRDFRGEIELNEVVRRCFRSGANQLLFVIDACHAGAGLADAHEVAQALNDSFASDGKRRWFGFVVSCRPAESARDGAFKELLVRLLTEGPRNPNTRLLWSRHNRLISGDVLGHAVEEEGAALDQQPDFVDRGRFLGILPNPLWEPDAPNEVVEHLLAAARGGDGAERSWFTGRVAEVDEVVGWVSAGPPGIRVVTGSAGTGKSAILGRVVSMSNPTERSRLLAELRESGWGHAQIAENSIQAHIHARGLTADQAAQLLDRQLVRSVELEGQSVPGVLPEIEGGRRRNATELVGALQAARQNGAPPPVIVVDGLDEARGEAFRIAEDLLVRLAPFATVIVSTRPITQQRAPERMLDVLAPVAVLDLDAPVQQESQRAAMRSYIEARLAGIADSMDPALVAEELIARASGDRESFLLARIVADQLSAAPIDTSVPGWQQYLAGSIGAAFDLDFKQVTAGAFTLPDDRDPPQLARIMLTALTWGLGGGFPEDEWLTVAAALAGTPLDGGQISWVLDQVGRYVIQGGEAGVAVYRIAHQSLADHLRPACRPTQLQPFDPAATPVWSALADRYERLLDDGHRADAPTYLWRYGYRHAAAAGLDGLSKLRELAGVDSQLQPDVAMADLAVADTFAGWGRERDALAPTEEAATLRRKLAATDPAQKVALAGALNDLGIRYSEVGLAEKSLAPTKEAVAMWRKLAAIDPGYISELAGALNNLGLRYRDLGRTREAREPTEKAINVYRKLVETNLAHLPALAGALSNLGVILGDLDRREAALDPSKEAVKIWKDLADNNPEYENSLAKALTNLGSVYDDLGKADQAVKTTEAAVLLLQDRASASPADIPSLARAFTNLGIYYAKEQPDEALIRARKAVTLWRGLAAINPVHLYSLAVALGSLEHLLIATGHPDDASIIWGEVLDSQPDPQYRAQLLVHRSEAATSGDLRAASWLAEAITIASANRALLAVAHEAAREHRSADVRAWDSAWTAAAGQPAPPWLSLDPDLLATARDWIHTHPFSDQYDYIAAHRELLARAADIAIEEALLGISIEEADDYRALRAKAQTDGIDAVYQPILTQELAQQFADAPPDQERQMLRERHDQLLDDAVRSWLAHTAAEEDASVDAVRANALLTIASDQQSEATLDAVFAALDQPELFPEVLHSVAQDPVTAATLLDSVSTIAYWATNTAELEGLAMLYRAAAAAINGDTDFATLLIQRAATIAPDQRPAWITLLAGLVAATKAVLTLIPYLTESPAP